MFDTSVPHQPEGDPHLLSDVRNLVACGSTCRLFVCVIFIAMSAMSFADSIVQMDASRRAMQRDVHCPVCDYRVGIIAVSFVCAFQMAARGGIVSVLLSLLLFVRDFEIARGVDVSIHSCVLSLLFIVIEHSIGHQPLAAEARDAGAVLVCAARARHRRRLCCVSVAVLPGGLTLVPRCVALCRIQEDRGL